MRITTVGNGYAITLGWLIALVVLVLDIVFVAIGQIDLKVGVLIGLLALARLV